MNEKLNELNVEEEYIDNFTLTKDDLLPYDIDKTFVNVLTKLRELRIARNKFINGYHARLTPSYTPRLEMFTKGNKSDPVGKEVEYRLDNEQEYNEFNITLSKLYSLMSKEENAYINDCLICGKPEVSIRNYFGLTRDGFARIKDSAIVRFGIVFNVIVMK